jgi:DNA/RNA-binding domain of Phe-tRNA-synthetase-like protein
MLIKIFVDEELRQRAPELCLKLIYAEVKVETSGEAFRFLMTERVNYLKENLPLENVSSLPAIKETRAAIKRCGKDPSRYRPAAEALMRRILKGNELFLINNVVDINNLISLESGYSIGVYDFDKITPPIRFVIGTADMNYEGIGRGKINVAGLPVFCDAAGPFASPVTDTPRSQVTFETRRILFNIIGFKPGAGLDKAADSAEKFLTIYAKAQNITRKEICNNENHIDFV